MNKKLIVLLVLIVVVGAGLRLARVNREFLGNFAQHQTFYATVVSNFIEDGINPSLPLTKFIGNGRQRPFLGDLPLTVTFVAILCKITGFSIETWGRGLSVVFYLLCLYPLYKVVFALSENKSAAFWSLILFLFSPLLIVYGQSFLLEVPALCLLIWSLYYLFKWREEGGDRFLIISAILVAFSIALRMYYSFYLVPVVYLFFNKYNWNVWRNRQPYIFFILALSVVITWQIYASHAAREYNAITSLQDNLVVFNVTHNFPDPVLFRLDFYKTCIDTLMAKAVTPVGVIMACLGIFFISPKERRVFIILYLAAFVSMFLVAPRKFYEFDFYYIPLVPVICILAGNGFAKLMDRNGIRGFVYVMLGLIIILAMRHSLAPAFITPAEDRNVLRASSYVKEIVPKHSRIIALHGSSVDFLHYCNRVGWTFDIRDNMPTPVRFYQDSIGSAVERLERLRQQGAEFFTVADKEVLKENPILLNCLMQRYRLILEKDDVVIFDLREIR